MDGYSTASYSRFCLGFRKTHSAAILPKVGTEFSAGSDLHALFSYTIPSHDKVDVRTGVALDFVIKDNDRADKLQQLISQKQEEDDHVRVSSKKKLELSKHLRSSLKTTASRPRSRKKVIFKNPVVDNVYGDVVVVEIKNECFFLRIRSRSGMAANHSIVVVGYHRAKITSSNRGEIIVTIANLGPEKFNLEAGMRFAQAIIHVSQDSEKGERFIQYKLLEKKACTPALEVHRIFGKMPVFSSMEYGLISPGSSMIVRTGVAVSLPSKSCYMQLQSLPVSSGVYATENFIHTAVHAGVIDTDYRGEVKVLLRNYSKDQTFIIEPGMPLAVGVIYDVACPVTRLINVTKNIENFIKVDNEMNKIDIMSPRFISSGRNYNLVIGECASSFIICVQKNFSMNTNYPRIVKTGVYLNEKELKKTGLVIVVQTIPTSTVHIISWDVDNNNDEIMLLVRSKSDRDVCARKGELLAQVYFCSSPKERLSLVCTTEFGIQERGMGGFGSTGLM